MDQWKHKVFHGVKANAVIYSYIQVYCGQQQAGKNTLGKSLSKRSAPLSGNIWLYADSYCLPGHTRLITAIRVCSHSESEYNT